MKTIFAIYLVLAAAATTLMAGHVIDESESPHFLLVLSAESGSYEGETLTLTGVSAVVYFSDRPYRIAGHLSVEKFVKMWGERADDFAADPPNATLSIFEENVVNNVVIEMIAVPDISGDSVIFPVEIILGDIPEEVFASSLFIDDFCRVGHSLACQHGTF